MRSKCLRELHKWPITVIYDAAVSALSTYPWHRVHRYRRASGLTCRSTLTDSESASVGSALDVSWSTCRYLCDEERTRPCIAFIYRSSSGHYQFARRPTSAPRCLLISTVCELVNNSSHDAVMYVKGPLLTRS